jgi:CubicO group peptidase (beta-lactamase class C family)
VAAATSPAGSSPNVKSGYGWHWWVAVEGGYRTFFARGLGGQFIYVVSDLDLVTVITSDPDTGRVDSRLLITRTIMLGVKT